MSGGERGGDMSEEAQDPAREASADPPVERAHRQPDYRMSLAAERTYLAYLRTGLALTAAGVAVVAALPDAAASALRRGLGLGLVIVGGVVFLLARPRWAAVVRAMERGEPLPRTRIAPLVAFALVVAAVVSAVIVLIA